MLFTAQGWWREKHTEVRPSGATQSPNLSLKTTVFASDHTGADNRHFFLLVHSVSHMGKCNSFKVCKLYFYLGFQSL